MIPNILIASAKDDQLFWCQCIHLPPRLCRLTCAFSEDELLEILSRSEKHFSLIVIGASLYSSSNIIKIGEYSQAPIVFAVESSVWTLCNKRQTDRVHLILVLPEDETVIAQMLEHGTPFLDTVF